jgi:hypothetical protein
MCIGSPGAPPVYNHAFIEDPYECSTNANRRQEVLRYLSSWYTFMAPL